jgi:hypothetical protein
MKSTLIKEKSNHRMQKINTKAFPETNYNILDRYSTMTVQIIVKILPDIAPELHQQRISSPELEELSKIQRSLDIVLAPVHPRIKDSSLASYFTVEVPDEAKAKLVIERLKLCKAVDAAYIKPSDELPGAAI